LSRGGERGALPRSRGRGGRGDSLTKRNYAGGALSFGNQSSPRLAEIALTRSHTIPDRLLDPEKQSVDKGRASMCGDPYGLASEAALHERLGLQRRFLNLILLS
jgi:hypothetical protein